MEEHRAPHPVWDVREDTPELSQPGGKGMRQAKEQWCDVTRCTRQLQVPYVTRHRQNFCREETTDVCRKQAKEGFVYLAGSQGFTPLTLRSCWSF